MAEVMIPPWVRPESPETIRWIDDATLAFPPVFGRGMTQRAIWADPRWGLRRMYRGLRSDEKAAILKALNNTRGQLNILRVTPHAPLRGSMPTTELITNNTFANGTTGWETNNSNGSLSSSDRTLRVARIANTSSFITRTSSDVTVSQYVPYAIRVFASPGQGPLVFSNSMLYFGASGSEANIGGATPTEYGFHVGAFVPLTTSGRVGFADFEGGKIAGDYHSISYFSLAQCALVDNGPNMLVRSDEFDNASWTKSNSSINANFIRAPDGTMTGDGIIENSSAGVVHAVVQQPALVSSSAADFSLTCALRAGTRSWAYLNIEELTGGHLATAWFRLDTGVVGSTSASGANWSNIRSYITSLGDGWYLCAIVARKVNAATGLQVRVGVSTGDTVLTYTGDGSSYVTAWRATMAQSSMPTRLVQTTTTATSGTAQTGAGLYTKGWPASTSGLLLASDWFECNGELKQVTAPVNSDGACLAYIQFRPAMADSPDDNDPVIVLEPFGRFIYPQGTKELENIFGLYGDCEMNLEEVYV